MIFPVGGFVIGALFGAIRASMKGGKTLDLLQWGAVHGILFAMVGLFVLVFIERSMVG
ncbi:hypothetical protein SAMN04488003_10181 [Loktanella fryxellensis]|uniref:PEP-CTERM protein-sorting domain-containing protein n=1 Tax=Loktanella fryxellensis TaxID=245187 RepID=A0A1H7YA23_9RHOB|nr:hypothetical protein [Loktanella fryxellensis]SEM43032.1 hypothetical protein SAMN04488003_10181 [Loktanella fryxellensis]